MESFSARSSGVLLHPTSLPGPFHVGDIGPEAHKFVDFLGSAKQSWWQTLPVNPVGPGNSPYSTTGSLAGEPLLISLDKLAGSGLLSSRDIAPQRSASRERVNYAQAAKLKTPLYKLAFARFIKSSANLRRLQDFRAQNASWLEDFVLFSALSDKFATKYWADWPSDLSRRDNAALDAARAELHEPLQYLAFLQYCFYSQWADLRNHAQRAKINLLGDLPIFVSYESADVWANQKFFCLDERRRPAVVAGVPPDYFNRDGQLWGNALYDWQALQSDRFHWWIQRFRQLLVLFDAVRIDHFIGFHRYWEIPANAKTAKTGTWKLAPGTELFTAVRRALGNTPFIAEDLGLMTPEVGALRDKFNLPGMRVMQFGFAKDGDSAHHQVQNFVPNSVVYTGTHDNETTLGWFKHNTAKTKRKKSFDTEAIIGAIGAESRDAHWRLIRLAMSSVANTAIFPMQDILGLGAASRMNLPGTARGNWVWRMRSQAATKAVAQKLAQATTAFARFDAPSAQTNK